MFTEGIENRSIHDRFKFLLNTITSEKFLQMKGIGNEVPFFICPFNPKEIPQIEEMTENLIAQLKHIQISVVKINLYDLSIEMLQKRKRVWDHLKLKEETIDKEALLDQFSNIFDVRNNLIPTIKEKLSETKYDLIFITGIGEVFPYIRTHIILENMESAVSDKPVVLFFPGKYEEKKDSELSLFSKLKDNRYYRARNIYQYGQ